MSSDHAKRVAAAREKVAGLKADLARIEGLPIPQADALARVDETIAAWTDPARRLAIPDGSAFAWPQYRAPEIGVSGRLHEVLAWLAPDLLRDVLRKQVETFYSSRGSDGTSPAKVETERAALQRKLFEAEITEERAIVESESTENPVPRRADADPRAIAEA